MYICLCIYYSHIRLDHYHNVAYKGETWFLEVSITWPLNQLEDDWRPNVYNRLCAVGNSAQPQGGPFRF